MKDLLVIALGGNALDEGEVAVRKQRLGEIAKQVVELLRTGYQVVLTHGNGPQVGKLLNTRVGEEKGLAVSVAMTQGELGFELSEAIEAELAQRGITQEVVTVMTRVAVDPEDAAFVHPSKPIGKWGDEQWADEARREGMVVKQVDGKGWRQVVASPEPLRVMEVGAIKQLVASGSVVICGGGGGVPVANGQGVAAVIDKDKTASLLAVEMGARMLVIGTNVARVATGFGRADQQELVELPVKQARELVGAGEFGEGSMKPKVEAAVRFVEATGGEAVIGSVDELVEMVGGSAGTRVLAGDKVE